ncbi:hypothetical protein IIG_04943 [Bacillus cereus VD048]|uniref:Uncharacterized protein n=1 Tax=Bacillus cereus VD048 TaxID=1053226 RepID=J8E938_BACCE|nr:hypothetical protein IIG_04943 [Bacillus cereus VD048]
MYLIKVEKLVGRGLIVYSKCPASYGINTYDDPNGNYTGNIGKSVPYRIYERQDGY